MSGLGKVKSNLGKSQKLIRLKQVSVPVIYTLFSSFGFM